MRLFLKQILNALAQILLTLVAKLTPKYVSGP